MITVPEWYNASVVVDRNLEAGRAGKVAIYCGEDEVTYGELTGRIARLGHALRTELGVRQEDRVLLVLNDTPSFPVAFFAAMRIGAVPIPANTLLGAWDYRFFVENSRARVVIADAMYQEQIRVATRDLEEPVRIVFTNGRVDGALAFEDLLEGGEDELSPTATHRDDPAFWLYSSGSTGRPKAAVHLHHDINYTCETYARHVLEVTESDRCFSASKLFHAYGLGNGISFPYWAGASTVLYPGKPTPEVILQTAQRCKPTLFFLGAHALQRYGQPPWGRGLRSLLDTVVRLGGGGVAGARLAPLEGDVRLRHPGRHRLHGDAAHLRVELADALEPGSSGKPVPGYEAKILDEEGHPVEPGGAGYLHVKGDSAAAYYWRNHEKTKATMQGEWMFAG